MIYSLPSVIFIKVFFFLVARHGCLAVAAGVDKTECCESKGVTSQCLGVCSGNVTNLPANYFDCMTHLSSFASCYDIPMPETPPRTFYYCVYFYYFLYRQLYVY